MAGLTRDPKSGYYRILFRFGGKQFQKSLKTADEKEAEARRGCIEQTLLDIGRGRLVLPPGTDFWQFVWTDGKRDKKPTLEAGMTLEQLFRWYFDNLPAGAKGTKTTKVEAIHGKHVQSLLGAKRVLQTITGQDMQEGYVNKRAKAEWYGTPIRAETIKKEVATLQMVWNRAYRNKIPGVGCECPSSGLKYPKTQQKPPFQTWEQIAQTIGRQATDDAKTKHLWDGLFLDKSRVADVLEYARNKHTRRTYFYPLLVMIAHTGARLSECMRSQVEDFDFEAMKVRLREKKKSQSAETYRWVPMSPLLRDTMKAWLTTGYPGGCFAICRVANKAFHEQTLHDDFEWFFRGSKWEVLRGFHVFRHSIASNLAREGEDQRVIDELMGHQTEAMRKRYRHLFPEQKENAIKRLFA